MEDEQLLKIALLTASIGLVLLFYMLGSGKVDERALNSLSEEDLGRTVKVSGVVEKVTNYVGVTKILVSSNCELEVAYFGNISGLEKGMVLEAEGEYSEYRGRPELLADEVVIS